MKRTAKQNGTKKMMDLTPTWADIVFELAELLHNGPDRSLTDEEQVVKFWEPIYSNLKRMAEAADKWNEHAKAEKAPKASLYERVSPEDLKAEGLVLMPRSLLRPGQIEELQAWLRKDAAKLAAEADALEAEGVAADAIERAARA